MKKGKTSIFIMDDNEYTWRDLKKEKPRVLMIDDDDAILKTTAELLSKKGYETSVARTGEEAVKLAKDEFFNIALIDIVLPDIKGTQLLAKLPESMPKMRKIIITGHATLDNAIEAVNLGADAYIMKPI
ncbi:MAG: response regulator, partial [Candidatus Bathyarchaeota archaeon]